MKQNVTPKPYVSPRFAVWYYTVGNVKTDVINLSSTVDPTESPNLFDNRGADKDSWVE